MKLDIALHPDLIIARKIAYEPNSLAFMNVMCEKESQEYGACEFEIKNKRIKFRAAKITPTKIGQFVTLWKRIGNGPILPFDLTDQFDLVIVSVRKENFLGQFVFPKQVLYEKGFVSKDGKNGKRAMRVYPPWDTTDNQQAKKSQAWQLKYFFEIEPNFDKNIMLELLKL